MKKHRTQLSDAQVEKYNLIGKYLNSKKTDNYILIGDQDVTYMSELHHIFINNAGVGISGKRDRKKRVEYIKSKEIIDLYRSMIKHDEDFSNYINKLAK